MSDQRKQWTIHEVESSIESQPLKGKKKRLSTGSNIMPIIEDALLSRSNWFEITSTPQYQYPGVRNASDSTSAYVPSKLMRHIDDCTKLPHYTITNKHFLYTENQISKGHYNDNERKVVVDGESTTVRIRYATCKGVMKCPQQNCTFAASKMQKNAQITQLHS